MAKQNVNVGVSANDGTGDTLRDGAIKLNNVINELYTQLGDNTNLQVSIGSPSTNQVLKWNGTVFTEGDLASSNLTDVDLTGIGNGQVLKWNTANSRFQPGDDLQGSGGGGGNAITNLTNNGSNNVVISTHFLPNTDNTYDLGSNSLKFRDLYLSSSTIWMDDTGISIGSDQEITRRKRKAHTVHSIDTGATRTITSKLASENSTEEEGLRLRFNAMKVGTPLEIEDVNGNKIEATFASFTAEAGATRGTVTVSATGTANQTQELAVSGDVKISSKNKLITEQEDGAVDLGTQKLKFGFGELTFDTAFLTLTVNDDNNSAVNQFGLEGRRAGSGADVRVQWNETQVSGNKEARAWQIKGLDDSGSSNTADLDFGEDSDVSYLDLDWIITGDSNQIELDLDSAYATNYMDILGDSNELTFTGSGYGSSANDAAYFYLDLEGDSNVMSITQSSTLARDWLKIESNTSNSNICIVQNDGGTSTSC